MFKLWIIAFFMMWTPSFSEHEKATFDEIMNTIVMMTDKVKELDEIYHWTNETFEPMRITKGLFDDAATYASLAISTAQFAYQIKKDMEDAKEAEKQRIIEDQRFQTLKEQNIELMGKIDAVKNAVEQAANKISDAIMHQTFNMEVKLPLDKLMDSYAIMMKGMLPEDYLDFNTSCKALGHTPKDIISAFSSMLLQLYKTQLGRTYDDEAFEQIAMLEAEIVAQFAVVYPTCAVYVHGPGDNATTDTRLQNLKQLLERARNASYAASTLRNEHVWKTDYFESLLPYNPEDGLGAQSSKYYDTVMQKIGSLREPESYTQFVYLISNEHDFDNRSELYQPKEKYAHVVPFNKFGTQNANNFFIFGIPQPETKATCDFPPNSVEHRFLDDALEDEFCTIGFKDFLNKHCNFTYAYQARDTPGDFDAIIGNDAFRTNIAFCGGRGGEIMDLDDFYTVHVA